MFDNQDVDKKAIMEKNPLSQLSNYGTFESAALDQADAVIRVCVFLP